jgi:hypothetical protein
VGEELKPTEVEVRMITMVVEAEVLTVQLVDKEASVFQPVPLRVNVPHQEKEEKRIPILQQRTKYSSVEVVVQVTKTTQEKVVQV